MTDLTHLLPPWANLDRWHRYQLPVVQEILDRYAEGHRLVLLDASTGAGKSLIGEMVRAARDVDAITICSSRSLQHQQARSFPRYPVLMGRSNYTPTHPEPDNNGEMPTCADCDIEEGVCSHCADVDDCPYRLVRAAAVSSPNPCLNYAYFFGETSSPRSKFSGRDFVICDEAHGIQHELRNFVSISISPSMSKTLNLKPPRLKTKEDAWIEWFDYALPTIERNRKNIKGKSLSAERYKQAVNRMFDRVKTVAANPEGYVYTGYENGRIEFRPVLVDKVANETLWRHGKTFLCMSATLGSPEAFVNNLGWTDSYGYVEAPSSFPPERCPIFYVPQAYMTKKEIDNGTAMDDMTKAIEVVLEKLGPGRVLVHTDTFKVTDHMLRNLQTSRMLVAYMNSSQRDTAIEEFEATEDAVLLAASLEQGYDGANDKCRHVIIAKTNKPYLGDKQVKARMRMRDGELWYANEIGQVFTQACGRAMRHEEDTCTVTILDSYFGKFYSDWTSVDGGHRIFPKWFLERLHLDSEMRRDIRWEIRQRTRQKEVRGTSISTVQ